LPIAPAADQKNAQTNISCGNSGTLQQSDESASPEATSSSLAPQLCKEIVALKSVCAVLPPQLSHKILSRAAREGLIHGSTLIEERRHSLCQIVHVPAFVCLYPAFGRPPAGVDINGGCKKWTSRR
jgi:hypothetical protein